jgi:hypothetical protein
MGSNSSSATIGRKMALCVYYCLLVVVVSERLAAGEPPDGERSVRAAGSASRVVVSEATTDARGFRRHTIRCEFQDRPTAIRVLLPERREPERRYTVIYLLPVEAGAGRRWGDPLPEVERAGWHNRYGVIFVYPTFARLPWYCDHPTDPDIRQEAYFLNVVVPFVERTYPARRSAAGRLLLGFSKSGWGAWSLLLRHPDRFSKAVAWDAPLMMDRPGKYGSGPIFGSQSNFDRYCISRLVRDRRLQWGDEERLGLWGYDNFRGEHQRMHELLDELGIPHAYRDGPRRKHHWNSGWLAEAVAWILHQEKR